MQPISQKNNHLLAINNHLSKHFIFNTLNSINSFIIDNDAKIATNYLSKFGKLLRLVIENSTCETISLFKEIEALQLYMIMEKMRFSDSIQLDINIDENIDPQLIKVPPLILHPFIENAIWDSLASGLPSNKIILDIKLKRSNEIEYSITKTKTNGKPKLQQMKLPVQILEQMNSADKWITKNSSLFNIELIDLYNLEKKVIAQKTIINIPINK